MRTKQCLCFYKRRCSTSKMHLTPPPPHTSPGGLGSCPFLCGRSVVVDLLFIVVPIVCRGSVIGPFLLFSTLCLYSSAIIMIRQRELAALLLLASWCIMTVSVLWFFLMVSWVGLLCMIEVFPDHNHLVFWCHYDSEMFP